mmetsp:Transcript_17233/g.53444  ORF Transcript_17233/g.53444 Transcript_17233/m.53444 type:complete len:241 (+) Transcript_17233:100-822(+)
MQPMSSCVMMSRPAVLARMEAGVSSCTTCRSDVRAPTSPSLTRVSSSTASPSVCARMARICTISCGVYGSVRMITKRSSRSTGMPCGDCMSVPRMVHTPRLVAKMTMGARLDSSARLRKVKHSMSSMWTSSTKSTPGTSSATPWSMYRLTTLLISCRSLSVISVFLGFIIWPIMLMMSWPPCGRALAVSRSCNVTSCTISFFLCTSPLGSGTYSSASRSNSVEYASQRPTRLTAPELASM